MDKRPTCPACASPIDRMQHSFGIVAAYPCNCWLTRNIARQMAAAWRTRPRPED